MKKGTVMLVTLVVLLLIFLLSIPIVNDNVAKKTAERIKDTQLPNDSEYVESFSAAGKLVGNGNGMQYLGGILIRSEQSLEALKIYYAQFSQNEGEFIVENQRGRNVSMIEHGTLRLESDAEGDNYFIVYTWGDNDTIFDALDIRGH